MTLSPGTRLGPYRVAATIGAGGMGEVYRARDTRLDRDVAIKILPAEVAGDQERLRRFEQEARAASSLNHPNILTVHDLGNEGGVAFLVTELLEGDSLSGLVRNGPLPEKRALAIASGVAKGLAAAHGKGIVHRDLKPDNLFVTGEGAVKILDFGLAQIEPLQSAGDSSEERSTLLETVAGSILGTPGYMAPEQVRGERADARTDLFALGCVCFEMLAGSSPFRRPSTIESLSAILTEPAPEFEAHQGVQPDVARIIERLLEKDPARRFHSAADLAFALEGVGQAHGGAGGRVATAQDPPSGVRWRFVAATLGLLTAGLAVAVWWPRAEKARPRNRIQFELPPPRGGSFPSNPEMHNLALSPDGRILAYVASIHGQSSIQLRDFSKVEPHGLEGTEGAYSLFWAPDGRSIGFFAGGKLKRIALDSGTVQVICDVQGAVTASWGSTGSIVFSQSFGPNNGLFRVPAAGAGESSVRIGSGDPRWIDFLPDGRRFLYWDRRPGSVIGDLYLGDLGGAPATKLLELSSRAEYAAPGWLVYINSGALVAKRFDIDTASLSGDEIPLTSNVPYFFNGWSAFSVAGSQALAYQVNPAPLPLLWVDRHGREIGRVGSPARYLAVRLSPDGESAAVTISDPVSSFTDVWIIDLERGGSTPLSDEPFLDWSPTWSPEGDRVVYTSVSPGPQFTVTVRGVANGEKLAALPPHATFLWVRAWTRLGLYMDASEPQTRWDLLRLRALDSALEPILQTPFSELYPVPSPNGEWLAFYHSSPDGGEVALLSLEAPSRPVRVAAAQGTVPRWRADGRELFYVSADGWLSAVRISNDRPPKIGEPEALFRVDLADESGFDVTPDGQRFLLAATRPSSSLPITIELGWQADLPAPVPGS